MPVAAAVESLDHHRGKLRARADQAARRAAIAEAAGDHPRAAQARLQESRYRRAADAADRRLRRNAAQRTAVLAATLTHQAAAAADNQYTR